VRFTRTQAEEIWNGDSAHDQWTEIFPSLAADADCAQFITRIVRFDDSGTTFALKAWLDKVNPARDWDPGFTSGPDTRNWPNAALVPRTDCNPTTPPTGPQGTHLTSGCSNGNGSLMATLNATDGSVGYSDIATARSNGLGITPTAVAGSRDDDKFWTQTTNPSGTFVEATSDPNGYQTNGPKGANCEQVTFTGVPSSTLGDWSNANGTDSANGWVICTLTYGLVWDDYKGPYNLQGAGDAAEEQKARTVKDYWKAIVSDGGQETLFASDYAQLPANILNISRTGVNAVCWDKPGSGGCPTEFYGYPRPKGATPLYASLVPAYNACSTPNRQHGPPLAFASCNPPVQSSGSLTIGSPDANGAGANSVGFVKYNVLASGDVSITTNITDVRNQGTLTDYTGEVQVTGTLQVTDRQNGGSEQQPATGQATSFPVTVGCTATGSTTIGGTCAGVTSANALVPGAVKDVKRTIWQMGQVTVNDGGADGLVSTGPNTVFAKQGVFIP
jgi:ABC-type phosphate transport system substrate-binding protein